MRIANYINKLFEKLIICAAIFDLPRYTTVMSIVGESNCTMRKEIIMAGHLQTKPISVSATLAQIRGIFHVKLTWIDGMGERGRKSVTTGLTVKGNRKRAEDKMYEIKKEYEGKGIGRALFTNVVGNIDNNDLPIFSHTQPESYRAIKLYSDFCFKIAMNNKIGNRINNINDSIEYLKMNIPKKYFNKIGYINIPEKYLKIIEDNNINDF